MSTRHCIFLHAFADGGAEKMLVILANQIAARGELVDIVVANAVGPLAQSVNENVRIIDLKCVRTSAAIWPFIRYLRKERPVGLLTSIIHANIAISIAHFLARSSAKLVLREAGLPQSQLSDIPALKVSILKLLARWAYRRADAIVSVSKELEPIIRNELGVGSDARVEVIYNPLASNFDDLCAREPEIDLSEYKDLPLIVAMGRLIEAKGFHILLQSILRLKDTHPVRVMILGEGVYRTELESLARKLGIREQVLLPGYVEFPQPIIQAADVFVLSSFMEGLPNSLIEAVACGTPVVATDCPTGPSEVLENGRLGALIPINDVEAMTEAIRRVLEGDIPVFDRDAWREKFDLDKIVDQYLSVMDSGYQADNI